MVCRMRPLFVATLGALTLLIACGGEVPMPEPEAAPPVIVPGADSGTSGSWDAGIFEPHDAGIDGGSSPDAGQVAPVRYASDIQPIWQRHCVGCHSQGSFMDLESPGSRERLVAATMTCDAQGAGGKSFALVLPRNPEQSALWIKLQTDLLADPNPQVHCNREMPATGKGLKWVDPEAFALVERWIREGAPGPEEP